MRSFEVSSIFDASEQRNVARPRFGAALCGNGDWVDVRAIDADSAGYRVGMYAVERASNQCAYARAARTTPR
ncbi:hypothetical protein D3C79_895650 [compost metagenome]